MQRLRYMSVFAHIVDCGSITAAADKLDLSKSVVSQHLKSLETELGVTLLKRTTRKQWLTSAGEQFYQQCKAINQVADFAWNHAQSNIAIPQGKVRITAANAIMETLVTPAIAILLKRYPLLRIELISSDNQLDIAAENIDLAIRIGNSPNSAFKQRRIGQFRDVLCGHINYLSATASADRQYIANLWQGEHIVHHFTPHSNNISQQVTDFDFSADAHCVANSFYSCLALIESGVGIGLIPDFHPSLEKQTLQAVFEQHKLASNPIYVIHPYGDSVPTAIQVCISQIEQQLHSQQVN
ncbi:LysR family transcriptional regulator [Shewanella waksmanii]|uniref:LysR family transcriptional regulator n=1 Tax=Shewanella waksmanii TaxID=213783 RepID=UPI003734E7B4